jgi:hypothetical protein
MIISANERAPVVVEGVEDLLSQEPVNAQSCFPLRVFGDDIPNGENETQYSDLSNGVE